MTQEQLEKIQENCVIELLDVVAPYQEPRHLQKSKLVIGGFGQVFLRFDTKWATIKNKVKKTLSKYDNVIFFWDWDSDAHCLDITFIGTPEDKTLKQYLN